MTAVNLLQSALESLTMPGNHVGCRVIASGDEQSLLPEEQRAFSNSVDKVRRASGAARIVARRLLVQLGTAECAIPKTSSGAPIWPAGIVGSLAHDAEVAVAAVAKRSDFQSLGIDVEPADMLDTDLLPLVATARERRMIADDPRRARLLFAIKEAIYKAVYPLQGVFLEHHDVEADLAKNEAVILGERVVKFRYCVADHIVVLAHI
jgi:4'-phosphopantetheinyl transferase EntD